MIPILWKRLIPWLYQWWSRILPYLFQFLDKYVCNVTYFPWKLQLNIDVFWGTVAEKSQVFFKSFCKNVLPSHRQKKKNVFLEPLQFFTTERITILVILSNRRNMKQVSKNQTNNSQENHSHGKVPFISKLAYGMGDVGCNFSWMFVGNFLMIFYTDVFGISMSAVATLMLISRFWDGINDPIIGTLTDKTRTRWGRFRPWPLFGAPITALVLILTFWAHNLSGKSWKASG